MWASWRSWVGGERTSMQDPTRQFGTLPPVHILIDGSSAHHGYWVVCSTPPPGKGLAAQGLSHPITASVASQVFFSQKRTADGPLGRPTSRLDLLPGQVKRAVSERRARSVCRERAREVPGRAPTRAPERSTLTSGEGGIEEEFPRNSCPKSHGAMCLCLFSLPPVPMKITASSGGVKCQPATHA